MQFFMLSILCLCYGLTISLCLTVAYATERREQPYFITDAYQTSGAVYRIQDRESSLFFRRRSGNISSIALCRRRLFFCSTNDRRIYLRIGQRERVVFEHNTYVRDIAVDSRGNLYFSEANGGKGDGRIYQLTPAVNNLGSQSFSRQSNQPFYTVQLNTVDRFWAGDFTFDEQGNLYLSTGDRIPAFIYRVSNNGGQYGSPQRIYRDTQRAVKGIAIDPSNPNFAYYADWRQTVYRLDIRNSRRSVEFSENITESKSPHLSDVAFDIRIENE